MQNRITKTTCQIKKNKRVDRLRDLLQLAPSDSVLLDACARKPPGDVKEILEALPEINPDLIRDKHLRTPLHIACSRKDDPEVATEIAKLLIQAGSDVNNGMGDVDGLQPIHMAVLAGNYQCVLMLLQEAKLKMDNLRQSQHLIHNSIKEVDYTSQSAKDEYEDLKSITQVLVNHLANKHINTYGLPSYDSYHGLSDFLFLRKESDNDELNNVILSITDKLALIGMNDDNTLLQDSINGLIEKVKRLGINGETVK
ncbi:uncharacterized protein BX663DRAFT_439754 [Cokeromyces recurvatus]|uniref:uncharacterized protein n=1 Tax=Cokeromyces recurvatus TaxID=90255 RepID=UPI002220CF9E|nr:uncharacterized protein BX663DRAFT_439754 [Cokeromyces recurvatus]KAI7900349.1 hypothetical protein BX663DRAFT_439754 [Cokeromyces recurvatus]